MSLWRHLSRGLRVLTNRTAADRDVSDEVQHYLEQATADLVAKGHSPAEARRAAQMEIGNVTVVREEVRDYGWENTIGSLLADVRYATRRLRQKPGFTAASVVTLAVGIGATTAIFSVINGVLLKPLPYPNSEQLVAMWHSAPGVNITDLNMGPSLYFTYRDESRTFQDIGLWNDGRSSVTGLAEPEEVRTLLVTNRVLPMLHVEPVLGRAFTASDDDPSAPRVAILTDGYWKSRFGGDRSAIGRHLIVDGNPHEVIGVLPSSFEFQDRRMAFLAPLRFNRAEVRLGNFSFQGIARLKPGATLQQAAEDVRRMLPMVSERFAPPRGYSAKLFDDARIGPNLRLLKDDLVGDIGDTLWVLMGTLSMVLLIACANVANLLLVRAEGRHQELALRAALGAGAGRIARELLVESLVLGVAGGLGGLALAHQGLRALAASDLANLPRVHEISIDPLVLAFALVLSLGSGIAFGVIPAWRYARPQLSNALRGGGRAHSASRERRRARSVLVVVQVALALILLVSSGLMIRTFQALRHVDPGFSGARDVQALRISIPQAQLREPDRVLRMQQEIAGRIASIPGVASAAIVNSMPMTGGSNDPIYAEDRVYLEGKLPPIRRYKYVAPGYVAAIGSRLIAGRDLNWGEIYGLRPVALVSENLARELWNDPRAAVGKRIRATLRDHWSEVVGVVADLRDNGLDQKAPTIVYWPLMQKTSDAADIEIRRTVNIVARTPRAGTAGFLDEVRRAVASVNRNLPLAEVRTLEVIYERALSRTSFTLALLAIAGVMALLLGVVGIYGVVSYSVSQRTREIGIRLALGAPGQEVRGMFLRHGLALSGIGAGCGLAAAFALTRLMRSLLFDVSPADPLAYAVASACLMAAAALACYLPARRATKVDPAVTLRAE